MSHPILPTIKLFLSYAHDDEGDTQDVTEFLQELNKCFKASKHFRYELWADRDLLIGEEWHEKITGSLEQCDYGLMLVSLSFITSDYIRQYELPQLLSSGRALPVGFKKIDLDWFDSQGISDSQVFYHKHQFYGDFGARTQGRSNFVQALVREIENKFLTNHSNNQAPQILENNQPDVVEKTYISADTNTGTKPTEPSRTITGKKIVIACAIPVLLAGAYFALPTTEEASDTHPRREEAIADTQLPSTVNLANNLQLVRIPAGNFQMGSNQGADDEKPVHTVTIPRSFWMSKTETTFAQYDAYANANNKPKPKDEGWGRGTRPVINVYWNDAKGYAKWISANNDQNLQCRLPSEAEWEYAARAGTTTEYSWGDDIGKNKANCNGCGSQWDNKQTAPVGSFSANQFGLQDMHGNVWEWTQGRWHKNYQGAPVNGSAWDSDNKHPVLRGGSWQHVQYSLRSAYRNLVYADASTYGFRIVCSPPHVR